MMPSTCAAYLAPLPDLYRGEFKRHDVAAGAKYAAQVERIIAQLSASGAGLCGFLAESWPSVAGQMSLPADYVQTVYRMVRATGGVCIADEVQTGYGRLGDHFWGFEYYGVVPDIVVLGKPIGNGHPLGAVVTTPEIARSFDNGMEFFSTFGGSTVSSAIGLAVLDVVLSENLQHHALEVGRYLLGRLQELKGRHALIGEVRGAGLFLGLELVTDRESLAPATSEAALIANRMRERGVLLGTEGPHHNVLKIRPPLPFTAQDAGQLVETLDAVLAGLAAT